MLKMSSSEHAELDQVQKKLQEHSESLKGLETKVKAASAAGASPAASPHQLHLHHRRRRRENEMRQVGARVDARVDARGQLEPNMFQCVEKPRFDLSISHELY